MRIFSSKVLGSAKRLARVMFFIIAAIPVDGPVGATSSKLVNSVQLDIDPDGASDENDLVDDADDTVGPSSGSGSSASIEVQSEMSSVAIGDGNVSCGGRSCREYDSCCTAGMAALLAKHMASSMTYMSFAAIATLIAVVCLLGLVRMGVPCCDSEILTGCVSIVLPYFLFLVGASRS